MIWRRPSSTVPLNKNVNFLRGDNFSLLRFAYTGSSPSPSSWVSTIQRSRSEAATWLRWGAFSSFINFLSMLTFSVLSILTVNIFPWPSPWIKQLSERDIAIVRMWPIVPQWSCVQRTIELPLTWLRRIVRGNTQLRPYYYSMRRHAPPTSLHSRMRYTFTPYCFLPRLTSRGSWTALNHSTRSCLPGRAQDVRPFLIRHHQIGMYAFQSFFKLSPFLGPSITGGNDFCPNENSLVPRKYSSLTGLSLKLTAGIMKDHTALRLFSKVASNDFWRPIVSFGKTGVFG